MVPAANDRRAAALELDAAPKVAVAITRQMPIFQMMQTSDAGRMQNGGGRERLSAVGVECKPTTTTEATFLKKHTALIAAAALALSAGLASAQTQTPRNYDSSGAPQTSGQRSGGGMSGGAATGVSSGMTGAPSSTNPQAGGGPSGLTTAPHQVPENGGAPNATAPGSNAR